MNLLLDTHVLLWWQLDDPRLSKKLKQLILERKNHVLVSSISFWEIAIKHALKKLPVKASDAMACAKEDGFRTLSFDSLHAVAVENLPRHHADPFDRALIAQAKQEKLTLVTCDAAMRRYASSVSLADVAF
jgi:PIN domain nuclease of toxin-antitoxin system